MLSAFSLEPVVADVQTLHRPDDGYGRCTASSMGGADISEMRHV